MLKNSQFGPNETRETAKNTSIIFAKLKGEMYRSIGETNNVRNYYNNIWYLVIAILFLGLGQEAIYFSELTGSFEGPIGK